MAINITTDLVDVNLSEATTNYAVLGTWATAIAASEDTYVQSSYTVGGRISAATGWAHTSIAAKDFSVDSEELHIFQWLKCITVPKLDTKANGGLGITISSDATPTLTGTSPNDGPTNSKNWWVAGSADALSGWICYVVNPRSTPSLTLGSPLVNAIQRIGIREKVVGTVGAGAIRPINALFDATRYGTGLTYTGDDAGTPGNFANILATAMTPANAWGILTEDSSIYFGAGKFNFGTTGQTATSSFKSTGQLFVWRNFPVAVNFYAWKIRGNVTYNTTFQIGNYASGLTSGGNVVKGAGDPTTSSFATWSLDVGTNTTCNLYGSQLSELYRGTLQSTSSVRGCTIKNFGNITANGATIDSCTFQDLRNTAPINATYGIVVATSTPILTNNTFINCATAVSWNVNADTNTKLDDSKFISGGTGHAIELGANIPTTITLTNVTFSGYGTDETTNATIYNNSEKAITINITGGTTPTVRNGTGASTTVISGTVSTTVTVKTLAGANIQDARVLVLADSGGPMPYNATVTIINSGTTATVTHTAHGMATNDKVQIKGASLQANNGVFTITKIDADSYSYIMGSTPGSSPTGIIKATYAALFGLTNSSGIITMSRVFTSNQPISGRVRKSTDTPLYKTSDFIGTIDSTTGFSTTIQMIPDV